MSFPTNSLPAEFEAEHGSVDLLANDQPQEDSDDGEDEDLELGRAGQGVWLCKVSAGPRLVRYSAGDGQGMTELEAEAAALRRT